MKQVLKLEYFTGLSWAGKKLWAVWLVCLGLIVLLEWVRLKAETQFAFSSLAVLPVLAIAWIGGRKQGIAIALLAAVVWSLGELLAEPQHGGQWISVANVLTRLLTYGLVAILAAKVRDQLDREHHHATTDSLTGLKNRAAFLLSATTEHARAKRYQRPLTVIYIDLNDFKRLNDNQGHDAGDAALQATAHALRRALRSSDDLGRLGGDEFAVILPEIDSRNALDTGRKLAAAVNSALSRYAPVTVSLGVAWFSHTDRTFPEMLKVADGLMYEAKQDAENHIHCRCFDEGEVGAQTHE